jgi:hypothetical protein
MLGGGRKGRGTRAGGKARGTRREGIRRKRSLMSIRASRIGRTRGQFCGMGVIVG